MRRTVTTLAVIAVLCVSALAADKEKKVADVPGWDRMKTLVGNWKGFANQGTEKFEATSSFRMTGDGSAILNILGEGSPHEMVTMIHPDVDTLMVTHYCAAHNQPRMKYVPGKDPNQVRFEFVDGTNIRPGEGHMRAVTYVIDSPDHHYEDWVFTDGGKETTMRFDLRRAK